MNWEDNITKDEREILLKAINERLHTLNSVIERSKEENNKGWKNEVKFLQNFIKTFINIT
tara:strand:+ start:1308 stop:1487 length:180 start_codon:yes stop_codon:yes gene_type:complete